MSTYSRWKHMDEYLVRLQAQEESDRVPADVFERICEAVRKAMLIDQEASLEFMVNTMRRLKLVKYLDHAVRIYCQITGVHPITLNAQQEALFRREFSRVVDGLPEFFAFSFHCPTAAADARRGRA